VSKFDALAKAIINRLPPGEQEDARMIIEPIIDTARTFEQIGADLDRIATTLERIAENLNG
jgi:hypothetical protein